MMTPKEFSDFNSTSAGFEYLTIFPEEKLCGIMCSDDTLTFLTRTGIPTYAAPHFYFGDFDGQFLPFLCDWPWRKHSCERNLKARVIGSAPDESPVCIMENEQLFIYKTSRNKQLLNNSLPQAIGVFCAYAVMIDKAIAGCGDDVITADKIIPKGLIAEFEGKLFSIDPNACRMASFWTEELHRLKRE